ncbi:hypothetical protein R3P38DRAFT_3242143 [Favolaschia claudopus]|uniref:Uncharacterized protein n=1 Tax=Favolaschia claudopus TaxID=2862362 RepID=A0AAV9Z4V1_9AGAR
MPVFRAAFCRPAEACRLLKSLHGGKRVKRAPNRVKRAPNTIESIDFRTFPQISGKFRGNRRSQQGIPERRLLFFSGVTAALVHWQRSDNRARGCVVHMLFQVGIDLHAATSAVLGGSQGFPGDFALARRTSSAIQLRWVRDSACGNVSLITSLVSSFSAGFQTLLPAAGSLPSSLSSSLSVGRQGPSLLTPTPRAPAVQSSVLLQNNTQIWTSWVEVGIAPMGLMSG